MDSKDIRFTEKKVDDSWKDQAARERERVPPISKPAADSSAPAVPNPPARAPKKTSQAFVNLLSTLGYQAMFHLGEIPNPQTGAAEVNLEAAKEAIDLLIALKEKTSHNLSEEEEEIFMQILPELQMKYSQKA